MFQVLFKNLRIPETQFEDTGLDHQHLLNAKQQEIIQTCLVQLPPFLVVWPQLVDQKNKVNRKKKGGRRECWRCLRKNEKLKKEEIEKSERRKKERQRNINHQ